HHPAPDLSPLSFHDALPIFGMALGVVLIGLLALFFLTRDHREPSAPPTRAELGARALAEAKSKIGARLFEEALQKLEEARRALPDRKSTRLNSSHRTISYAV